MAGIALVVGAFFAPDFFLGNESSKLVSLKLTSKTLILMAGIILIVIPVVTPLVEIWKGRKK